MWSDINVIKKAAESVDPALLSVFQHYPLFRVSDASCTGQDAAPPEERHLLFREKYDVLSKEASQRVSNTPQSHHTTLFFLLSQSSWSGLIRLKYSRAACCQNLSWVETADPDEHDDDDDDETDDVSEQQPAPLSLCISLCPPSAAAVV